MAVKEVNALIQVKDDNGDINIIYPVTRSENVYGMDTIPDGVVSYTDQVDSDSHPNEYEGHLQTNDGIVYPITKSVCVVDNEGRNLEDIMGQNPIQVQAVISADSWEGNEAPFTNTIQVTGVTETSVVDLITPDILTSEEINAFQNAFILSASQTNGFITLSCWGTVPTIDLPVIANIRGNSIKALEIDTELSETSNNPVVNSVITKALKNTAAVTDITPEAIVELIDDVFETF